jgi:hypothetical protein
MVETILSSALFREIIFPFLLVFAVVFALLQKSEVLGKGKKQTDAIVALVVGLLVVSVGYATDVITNLIPFFGVALIAILVFLLLWGMVYKEGTFDVPNWVKIAAGIIIFLSVLIALLYFTGAWGYLMDKFNVGDSNVLFANVIFIVMIIAAVAVVVGFSGKSGGEK